MVYMSMADRFKALIKAREFEPNPEYDKNLSKAYHEAGHLYFHFLYDIWFEYVTLQKFGGSEAAIHHPGFEIKETDWFWMDEDEQCRTFWVMSLAGLVTEAKYSSVHKWDKADSDLREMINHFPQEGAQGFYDETVNQVEENWNDIIDLANILNENPVKITRDELLEYPVVQKIIYKGSARKTP